MIGSSLIGRSKIWIMSWSYVGCTSPNKIINKAIFILAPSNRECNQYDGICQNKHIACNGVYVDGWCCGGANIQCCLTGRRFYTISMWFFRHNDYWTIGKLRLNSLLYWMNGINRVIANVYWIAQKLFYLVLIYFSVTGYWSLKFT